MKTQLKETRIELGQSQLHVVKKKSKFKPLRTGFCNSPSCLCTVELNEKNECMRCFNKVSRKQNYNSMKKWFDGFVKNNPQLQHMIFDRVIQYDVHIQVPIHKRIYYIPVRFFIEFQNLQYTEEYITNKEYALDSFFTHIKNSCLSVIA